ncbi:hypothetical protein [Massilibacteroides vaginae]|uniref:hypothetical protein n=1 Tax=Massilibacteroides vaginae TaxID=1673718 RepID=UPI000A1CB021|nr:hypothetical protein [Massilibacteroides vaginae]
MRIIATFIILAGIILSSCGNQEKEAKARLQKARDMYAANEFFAAKSEIDSIRILYPKEFKVLKESLTLMREVEIKEAERTLAYCDSLLPIRIAEIETLRKDFVYEKDSVYEEIGTFIWKQQTIERNINRCYIRSGVNEKGEMYLASVYYGANPINHTSIKLSAPGELFAETASIPYDGGVNYRFKDEGFTTEVVTYKGEAGLDAINLIYNNEKERIKVEYTGGKPYIIYIADADKKALVATFNLGTVLSDVNRMTLEMNKAQKRLEYLGAKLGTPVE